MKKELSLEEWKEIGLMAKEARVANYKFLNILIEKLPKTMWENKWNAFDKNFDKLRSHLDDVVCGKFLDHPDKKITTIFYGEIE